MVPNKVTTFLLLYISLALSGCASMIPMSTEPVSFEAASDIEEDNIFDLLQTKSRPDTFEVLITRDRGAVGSLCAVILFVNGDRIADFKPEERLKLHLPAGVHIFGIQYRGVCGDRALLEQSIEISNQSINRFRISSGMRTGLKFQPSALL